MKKQDKDSSALLTDNQSTQPIDDELNARRYCLLRMTAVGSSLFLPGIVMAQETDNTPLNFGFIKDLPGELISLETHRLHVNCLGDKDVTVLFEPGLGGSALEWLPIAEEMQTKVRSCIYDRAGYAWSDPGNNPRHVIRLANDARKVLGSLSIDKKVILVGHSYGGLIMRQLASTMPDNVIGLILVDASHEDQFTRLAGESNVSMLPTSDNFVVSAPELPNGLRDDIREKIRAFSRMRKTYSALHAEIASFRSSCEYIQQTRAKFKFPVIVISRGLDPYSSSEKAGDKNKIWQEMQTDFLSLSDNATQIIAEKSGHHVHIDQPELIKDAITQLLSMYSEVK